MKSETQEIIERMSPVELHMMMQNGFKLPPQLEAKAIQYWETRLNQTAGMVLAESTRVTRQATEAAA